MSYSPDFSVCRVVYRLQPTTCQERLRWAVAASGLLAVDESIDLWSQSEDPRSEVRGQPTPHLGPVSSE